MSETFDAQAAGKFCANAWQQNIVPLLQEYIRIPNKSPMFEPDWEAQGHMQRAVELLHQWCSDHPDFPDMVVEIFTLPGHPPVLLCDIPASSPDIAGNVLLYGHYDKQPEFTGWRDGLQPWEPVLRDGRLYGRGGADDGYAVAASLTAVAAIRDQGLAHPRCLILIEGCEESGSPDLPLYIDALSDRIGAPDLLICLDAECGNYDQWWVTTSLRGMASGTLRAQVLSEGVHSGAASGIVPSSFRVMRLLLDRLEDSGSGQVMADLHVAIPEPVIAQATDTANTLGAQVVERFPLLGSTNAISSDRVQLVLNNTWRPTLSVTGADELPPLNQAGNTLRPGTALKLSFRLPPTADAKALAEVIKQTLERDAPYDSTVTFDVDGAESGWHAPPLPTWLTTAIATASEHQFGKSARYMGTGGTIPFMKMLGDRFPDCAFLVTGVLGPHSNAHGPNEFLDLRCGERVTAAVSEVLAAFADQTS